LFFEEKEVKKDDHKEVTFYNFRLIHIRIRILFAMFITILDSHLSISLSSFRRALAGRFMYPVDRTDLCNLCAKTNMLEVKYLNNPSALKSATQQEALLDRMIHRRTNKVIRTDYNSFLLSPPEFEGLVLTDWLQNFILPMLLEQPSAIFYANRQVAVMVTGIVFNDNGCPCLDYYFVTSECLSKDNLFARECLDYIIGLPMYTALKTLYFLSDNAYQFRSGAYCSFALGDCDTLSEEKCCCAYLCPRHSKALCDSGGGMLRKHFDSAVREEDVVFFDDFFCVACRLIGPYKSKMKTRYFVVKFVSVVFGGRE
jgi:hypothetical protein